MHSLYKSRKISQRERAVLPALAIAGLTLMVCLLGGGAAFAFGEVEDVEPDAQKSAPIEWRSTGIAHIELPMGFRARFEATTTRNLYHSEDLAESFITGGPQLRYRSSLESRVSLSRALGQNVEFEIAWGARSPIENVDLLDFERQTVGALLRVVH